MSEGVEAIREQGFAVLEGLVDAALIKTIKAELAPFLDGRHMGRNDFEGLHSERVYALLSKAPSVAQLVEHPRALAVIDELLPANYLLSANLAIHVHPGETAQALHIDDAAGGDPIGRPRAWYGISAIWALDDFTADNGATEVVPGSHRWGPERTPKPEEIEPVLMPAGSALLFAGNLLHRGGANRSQGTRLAITPQYCAPWMRQIENMVLAVPPAQAARFSPRVQALLGYSVVDPGFMGYVDGVHPRRLLDPAYTGRQARGDLPS